MAGPGPTRSFSTRFAVTTQRPVAILMIVTAVCVFGWVSYQRLSLDLMPDIAYPAITVRTEYPGTAPEEVESLVSRPLEQELGIVRQLVRISSISKAGQSDVVLEFEWDTDMDAASQSIREKSDRLRLPEDAEKPLLLRYDPSLDPIIRLGLHGPQTMFELRRLADREIKRELEAIPGVAAVKVKGGLEEQIHVDLNEQRISLMGLDVSAINRALDQANVNLPGGQMREGLTWYLVRTINEFQTVDEIRRLIVAEKEGAEIRLGDVAAVHRSSKDREVLTRVDGSESVEIEIYKEADANIVAVAQRVINRIHGLPEQQQYVARLREEEERAREAAADTSAVESGEAAAEEEEAKGTGEGGQDKEEDLGEQKRAEAVKTLEHLRMTDYISHLLPEEMEIEVLSDQSVFIVDAIDEVRKSALIGGALAIFVLLAFLRNVLHTLIVGVTIPVSIAATFAPMYLFDVSMNIMSLGGLALGIGMLVDNSIVVLESIFRCREEGDDLVRATVRGTGEVGAAVFASTLTTIAVFFPIVFVEGVAGQVFGDMALTVVFSLLASLLAALYFIPMLASRRLQQGGADGSPLAGGDFLRLAAFARARAAAAPGPLRERAVQAALVLPQLLLDLALRIPLAVAALAAAVLKGAAVLLFEALWILLKPAELFWIRPQRTLQASFADWAGESRIGPWQPFERVWPNLLGYDSPGALAADAARLSGWMWTAEGSAGRRVLRRLARALPGAAAFLFLLVRFLFHALLRTAGIVLQVALLLAVLAVLAAATAAGVLLAPVFAPILFLCRRAIGLALRVYPVLLESALRQRYLVIAAAAACFWLCWSGLVPRLGTELIPQVHQGEFNLEVALPVGTPLWRTAEVVRAIEEAALEQPGVERVATAVGTDRSASSRADEGEHTARLTVKMVPGATPEEEEELIASLRRELADLPEVEIEVAFPTLFSFKTPVEVEVHGDDLQQLRQVSRETETLMAGLAGLADVRSTLQSGHPELQIRYDRERLAEFGLDLRRVAELVRNKVRGRVATDFRERERNIDVLVRLREADRLSVEELRRLVVNPGGEVPIALASVASIEIAEGPSEIRRIDQQRAALVTANTKGIDLGSASRSIEQALRSHPFPDGFGFLISGQNQEMETSLDSLLFALALALFLVYVVMASQFESLLHPLVIMFTVPLALIGVVAVLVWQQIPLSVVVFIGMIMLAGIVVNNAIVLVDYINTLRRGGMEKGEAIVRAGSVRLRPILMTTLTTVLGLAPMALGFGDGAEIRTPMAITVIAGLMSSTFLTLVVIPTVYAAVDRGR